MKIRIAIALLLLSSQSALAESFKESSRVVLRGLSPSTKYTIQYQKKLTIWKRYTVDRCGTIIIKKREATNVLGKGLNFEFRSDDDAKTITQVSFTDSQRLAHRALVDWDSKDSTKLNYKCVNGEIGKNLDNYWLNAGSGIRFHYHGRKGTQAERIYISGIDASNVHIRNVDAPDYYNPRMRRTLISDKCGQLFIRHNEKYPADGLGSFFVDKYPNGGATLYFNYNYLSEISTSTKCTPPNIIP